MMEILVVLVLMMLLAAISFPAIRTVIAKSQLETGVQQTAMMFQSMRLQAIRQSTTTRVSITSTAGENWVEASIDRDRDGTFESNVGVLQVHRNLALAGPPLDSAGIVGWTGDALQFNSDGSLAEEGAVRLSAQVGGEVRYYEVRASPVAAPRISVRQWDPLASEWVEEGDQ